MSPHVKSKIYARCHIDLWDIFANERIFLLTMGDNKS